MTNDWDFYACLIEDRPASVFVDLGLRQSAPIRELPHQFHVRLHMRAARADGLSSQQEFDALCSIEDALEAAIAVLNARFVGRTTSAGTRDFYFYCADPDGVGTALSAAMERFPEYSAELFSADDAEWKTYLGFLYPSERDRQLIQDRRTCDALERQGDVPTTVRKIDHWIYLPDESAANGFLAAARALGYQEESALERSSGPRPFGVRISKCTSAQVSAVNDTTVELLELSQRFGGDYDGWESPVMAAESE
jgi:regulator of RNase E activity RraB